jgi:hypothetical protein
MVNHAAGTLANAYFDRRREGDAVPIDCPVVLRASKRILAGAEILADYFPAGEGTDPGAFLFTEREQQTFPTSYLRLTVSNQDQFAWQRRWVAQQY